MKHIALTLVVFLVAARAGAQDERAEAEARYRQGITRYDAGDYEEALAAFTAAQRHLSTPSLLFALGRVHMRLDEANAPSALDHRVRALGYLEQYAATGGLPRPRREEVQAWIATLSARVGSLYVETNVEGAVILLRDVEVATSPALSPLRVSAGTLVVAARATGYDAASREVTIAGGETLRVRLELRPLVERRGRLRVRSALREVEVQLDGVRVGTTPLPETVIASAGAHVVEGRRPGYRTTRTELTVHDGAETEIELVLEVDPEAPAALMGALVLETPEPRQVWIDGEPTSPTGTLRMPRGPHRLRVHVAEREELELDVEVAERTVLRPSLHWEAGARAARLEGVRLQTITGWVLLAGGVALAGATVGFHVWAEGEHGPAGALEPMIDHCNDPAYRSTLPCSVPGGWNQDAAVEQFNASAEDLNVRRTLSLVGYVASAALTVSGLVLVLTAGDAGDVDRSAGLSLGVGPGSLVLAGRF